MSDDRFDKTVTTTCGYCGVGCSLEAHVERRADPLDRPRPTGPANHGHTCLKGRFAHRFSRHRERLDTPLIREGGELREASWDEAIGLIASELGPDQGRATAPTRSPASPPRAPPTRTAT